MLEENANCSPLTPTVDQILQIRRRLQQNINRLLRLKERCLLLTKTPAATNKNE